MYKIGIIGHGPERFSDREQAERLVINTLELLSHQYGDEVVFNIATNDGVGLWAAQYCLKMQHKYHLFLPSSKDETCQHWYDFQKEQFNEQYNNAYSLTVCNPRVGDLPYVHLIDNANFVICFWVGNKDGTIAHAIEYSLNNNKLILNGSNNLKLITSRDLRK